MKLSVRLFFTIYLIFVTIVLINTFWGEKGRQQTKQLQAYKTSLINNVKLLESKNFELKNTLTSVRDYGESVILAAREIGYFKKNQGVIRFGYPLGNKEDTNFGKTIKEVSLTSIDKRFMRLFAIFIGLLFFVFSYLVNRKKYAE